MGCHAFGVIPGSTTSWIRTVFRHMHKALRATWAPVGVARGLVPASSENQLCFCKVEVTVPYLQMKKQVQNVGKELTWCARVQTINSGHHFHWQSCCCFLFCFFWGGLFFVFNLCCDSLLSEGRAISQMSVATFPTYEIPRAGWGPSFVPGQH